MSFVEVWINLESVTQSEVICKEKKKCHVLSLIYVESRKMAKMNLSCRAGIQTPTEDRHVDMGARGGWERIGRLGLTHIHYNGQNRRLVGSCSIAQRTQLAL